MHREGKDGNDVIHTQIHETTMIVNIRAMLIGGKMRKLTKATLITMLSFSAIGMAGCTSDNAPAPSSTAMNIANTASISDEKLNEEELKAVREGTNFPQGFANGIIYDQSKMLLTYNGTSGCPAHPESVKIEEKTLIITFSESDPEKVCTAVMTGPFTKVINIPNGFNRYNDIKVNAVMESGIIEVPVVVN